MNRNSYQGYEVQKHRAIMMRKMWCQLFVLCAVVQLILLLALIPLRVNLVFEMVPAPYRELAWKWPVARLEHAFSHDGRFLLHSEALPHWWSGAMVNVLEVSAEELVALPYQSVFTSKDAHWGWAVSLSFLAWPLWFFTRRAKRKLSQHLGRGRLLRGRLSFLSKPFQAWLSWRFGTSLRQRCTTWLARFRSTRPVACALIFCDRQVNILKMGTGVSRLSELLPFPKDMKAWPGILTGCVTVQLIFLLLLTHLGVHLDFEMVPTPHRELALKWPVARLERALSLNGRFRLHSSGEVNWWDGKRTKIVEVTARELVTLPYARVFTSKDAHWGRALLISCLAWVIFPAGWWFFRRETHRINEDEHVRGARLCTEKELAAFETDGILTVGDIRISELISRRHFLCAGQTGSGKSSLIVQHLVAIQGAQRRALVSDFKGELVERFYRPGIDLILNPLDTRGLGWTIFNEIESKLDLAAIAGSLIPLGKGDERFWCLAAQDVLRGILAYCFQFGIRTNAGLWLALTASIKEMAEMCRATESGRAGYRYLTNANSKLAESVIAVLTAHVTWLELATDGPFSLREWSQKPTGSTIFITNRDEVSSIMIPYLSLFADLAGKRLLSLPENSKPGKSIYLLLDELGNMQRLPSVKRLLTAGRSKGLVIEIGIQELAGLESVYGREDTRTIINNCGSKMIMNLGDPEAAELFSDLCGQEDYWQSSTTYSISQDDQKGGENLSRQLKTRKVVMPAEIMRLQPGQGYFMLPGGNAALVEVPWGEANNHPVVNKDYQLRSGLSLGDLQARGREIAQVAREVKQEAAPPELKQLVMESALDRKREIADAGGKLCLQEESERDFSDEIIEPKI